MAATALEAMVKLYDENRTQWAMRYRDHVQPHVGSLPKHLIDGDHRDSSGKVGKHVGTLVHRALEMGAAFPSNLNDRRSLLIARATALIEERGNNPVEPGSSDPDTSGTIPAVIADAALHVLAKVLANNPFQRLLSAEGEPEIDFALPIGDWIITGRFDRLILGDGGCWEIVDWKTDEGSADLIVEKYRPQMKLYALALHDSLPDRPAEIVVNLAMTGPRESRRLNFIASDLVNYRNKLASELPRVGNDLCG